MDKIEFENLFLSCKSAVERFVYYKMPSKSDADDILQEVAISAYKNIAEIKNPESFKPWILKIAANKCNDFYRNLAKRHEILLDEITDSVVSMSRYGISDTQVVRDTLDNLAGKDKQILFLYYFKNKPQSEIASTLKIPVGTVKSRLHTAKQNFKEIYPFPPKSQKSNEFKESKGEDIMKKLPDIMPDYKIIPSTNPPFHVRCEESPGWFIIPKPGEKITWAIYEFTDKKRRETTSMEVTGEAVVHGIEGVEINAVEENPMEFNATGENPVKRTYVAQLTDTHCRFLAETFTVKNYDGKRSMKIYHTFLDGEKFNMYCGENNCGYEVEFKQKGIIKKNGNIINCVCLGVSKDILIADIVGRYDVEINGKIYDTVCFMDINVYNPGILSEQYIDQNGRTVLWRRFNRNDWNIERYNEHFKCKDKLWNEILPENEQYTVNGDIYVHWYDCITDYIL